MIDFAMGKQLGHYRLVRLLGTGGFAEVYLGLHIHLNTPAAIKVLHTRLREEGLEQFRNEAYAIARLRHPHIVRLLDFGIEAGQIPYLVMDYLPQGTLRQLYARGTQIPLPTVTLYTRQIAQALQYAHDARYIHRDVKPDNMLMEKSSHILLSDFSLAVVAHSTHSRTAQQIAGTIGYMAPEQIEEYPRPASDQYALGIVVYEWLCGQLPFHGTMLEMITKHCSVPPPPLRVHNPALSSDVERVVLRALEKEWQARFPTIGEFARALEQAAHAPAWGLSRPALFPPSPPTRAPASARSGPSAPLSVGNTLSASKQALWMLSYLLLACVGWVPYFVGFLVDAIRGTADAALAIPLLIYLLFLYLLLVPASVLLAGALFGGWRGGVVTIVYTGVIAFLVGAPLLFWGRVASGTTIVFYAILFCTWPLAALVTGVFCQRRQRHGFGKTYMTMLPGMLIMVAGLAPLILLEGSTSTSSSDIATSFVLLLCGVPLVSGILALPVAAIEIVMERFMGRAHSRIAAAGEH
jgi:hypothetical protein